MSQPAQYPLPYAFARSHQLLLEEQDAALTLWTPTLDTADAASAVGEVLRKFAVRQVKLEEPEILRQRRMY